MIVQDLFGKQGYHTMVIAIGS
ncbi:MAG: hypothetical protein RIR22_251, partial [Planctomycetota bacterium]